MICLENEFLKIWIKPKGAELKSIVKKETQVEYLWGANPAVWGKSSPVLFPIVGALKDETYFFEGSSYRLPRHGFARDREFQVEEKTATKATFLQTHDNETLKVYPFRFEFRMVYELTGNKLDVHYHVTNLSSSDMYFSVGGHPAFALPITNDSKYYDHVLVFNEDEKFERRLLTSDGLLAGTSTPIPTEKPNEISINKELFHNDALVFKNLRSNSLHLKSTKSSESLTFTFENFPYLGIWAAKDADFICIEPWCGIADNDTHNQNLTEKEGINRLKKRGTFERMWSVEIN